MCGAHTQLQMTRRGILKLSSRSIGVFHRHWDRPWSRPASIDCQEPLCFLGNHLALCDHDGRAVPGRLVALVYRRGQVALGPRVAHVGLLGAPGTLS